MPIDLVVDGSWPQASFSHPAGEAAQQVALRLRAGMQGGSVRQLARDADLQHTTVLALLRGRRWPDFVTLVKLEDALGVTLWPTRH